MMKLPKLLFFCWLLLHIILYKRSYIDVNKTVYKSSYVNGHFIVPGAQDPALSLFMKFIDALSAKKL